MIDSQRIATPGECQEPPWNLWGYGRASSDKQENSPEVQKEKIAKAAISIKPSLCDSLAAWIDSNIIIDVAVSGEKVPFTERLGYQELMGRIQKGDHLVVWRWDRLDRDSFRCVSAVGEIRDRGLHLHVLQYQLAAINLKQPMQALIAVIFSGFSGFENAQKTEASMAAKAYMRNMGVYMHGMAMLGYKLIWLQGKRSYRHDEAERMLVREIGSRVHWGTWRGKRAIRGVDEILLDFQARGEVTTSGKPWSRDRIRRAAAWWLGCIDRDLEPWKDCDPYTFKTAVKLN